MDKNMQKWITRIGVGVLILWFGLGGVGIIIIIPSEKGIEMLGQFGDSFGVLNTLFSGLAVLGVFAAVIFQWHEINDQRQELKEQRQRQDKQQFETTFFNMLNLLSEIVKGITFETVQGQQAFTQCKNTKQSNTGLNKLNDGRFVRLADASRMDKVKIVHEWIEGQHFEKYFRIIYTTLKFIEKSTLEYEEKKLYSNILRAQLSNDELFFLGYNCIADCKFLHFKMLVEKYTFLKHLPDTEQDELRPQNNDDNTRFYHSRAFDKAHKFSICYLEEVKNKFIQLGIDDFINYDEINDDTTRIAK